MQNTQTLTDSPLEQALGKLPAPLEPTAVSSFPAYGWFLLAFAIGVVLIFLANRVSQQRKRRALFHDARSALGAQQRKLNTASSDLDDRKTSLEVIANISKILRNTAASACDNKRVTAEPLGSWLQTVDNLAPAGGSQKLLDHRSVFESLYHDTMVEKDDIQRLLECAIAWAGRLEKQVLSNQLSTQEVHGGKHAES